MCTSSSTRTGTASRFFTGSREGWSSAPNCLKQALLVEAPTSVDMTCSASSNGAFLSFCEGAVQCNGYDAYDQFEKNDNITVYGCWAHVRRKFVDALNENNRLATEALCFIRKIYKVESDADKAGLNADERKEQRLKISYPTIRLFETWMKEAYLKVLPNSKMGDAIEYTYSLLLRLSRYVSDGRINIDNNLIENAIRPLALGRRNYPFCSNDASAYRAAIVYSLISTCKAADVDPRT